MKLLESGKIGKLRLKNRVVMAAMSTMLIELDGRLSRQGIDFYVTRAKGGVGLIITNPFHTRLVEQLQFAPLIDRMVIDARVYGARLNDLAEAVHDYGAKVCLQANFGRGRNYRGPGAVSSSPLPSFDDPTVVTRELSREEIDRMVAAIQISAEVARGAGIDAIEINAHGGYILDNFMTSAWNRRSDEYGGEIDNRLRFLVRIVQSIKKGAGADFPVLVKYGLTHHWAGGRSVAEGLEIAKKLEQAGVDALEIDAGSYETMPWLLTTTYQAPGCNVDLAAQVKQVVGIPVIAVGRLEQPELAERVLQEGKADFIALGKGLLADPDWVRKVKAGKPEDIRPCLGCNEACLGRTSSGLSINCSVNPACGRENELAISRAETRKTVLVVGGGPAGMEAALVAALRGHKVTLCEKSPALGGSLIPGAVPEFKRDYRRLASYLADQVKKAGVEATLETEVTPELVRAKSPDVVFVATGGEPLVPNIPGVHLAKVATAIDVLLGRKEAGPVVALIGGGAVGCEVALHLAYQGKQVTVVEMLDGVARDLVRVNRMHLIELLEDAGVKVLTNTRAVAVTDEGLVLADEDGAQDTLAADTLVLACGMRPQRELADALAEEAAEVITLGDCVEPRKVREAITEAYRQARLV